MNAASKLTTEHSSAITLRVDHLEENLSESACIVYCTDIEKTELRVVIPEVSAVDLQLETGRWYRFDEVVRTKSPEAKLLHPSKDTNIERIDTSEELINQPTATDESQWLVQLGSRKSVIAITVKPRPANKMEGVCIDNPETFEIGGVCFTNCNNSDDTTVYHREESATEDEHLLLEHIVEDLSGAEAPVLLTQENNHKPLELLYQRLRLASEGDIVPDGAEQVLEDCFHTDAGRVANRAGTATLGEIAQRFGIETDHIRFNDYKIGLSPADWREDWAIENTSLSSVSDTRMIDRDYSVLAEQYLAPEDKSMAQAQLGQCLKDYVSANIGLLRGLVTKGAVSQLGCRRFGEHLPDYIQST